MDTYEAWREASGDVQDAYECWTTWVADDRDVAFAGYLSALQREQHAAGLFQRAVETVRLSAAA
jgi:hypothetical protein